jgi:hypothetical protein
MEVVEVVEVVEVWKVVEVWRSRRSRDRGGLEIVEV